MKAELNVRTQGVRGGNAKFEDKGCATLYVTDRGQKRSDLNIDVDTFIGYGETYKRRDNALINISFECVPLFTGDIEKLINQLKK